MSSKEKIKFVLVRSLGNFLLLMSLYGVFATFGPVILAETQFRIAQVRGIHYEAQQKATSSAQVKTEIARKKNGFAEVVVHDQKQILLAKDANFSIVIPKIGANSKIFPNVDPSNPQEFLPFLQQGVAHARGSVFPGMDGNVYLFAHSADTWWNVGRYNAVFYLLLHMQTGDAIVIFFDDKRYDYIVTQTEVLDANDLSLLSQAQQGKQRLVLQTCWPPGTTWKRFYVIAEPKTI